MNGISPSCFPSTPGSSAGKEVGSEPQTRNGQSVAPLGHGRSFPTSPSCGLCVGWREPPVCTRVSPPSGPWGGAPGEGFGEGLGEGARGGRGPRGAPGRGRVCSHPHSLGSAHSCAAGRFPVTARLWAFGFFPGQPFSQPPPFPPLAAAPSGRGGRSCPRRWLAGRGVGALSDPQRDLPVYWVQFVGCITGV